MVLPWHFYFDGTSILMSRQFHGSVMTSRIPSKLRDLNFMVLTCIGHSAARGPNPILTPSTLTPNSSLSLAQLRCRKAWLQQIEAGMIYPRDQS